MSARLLRLAAAALLAVCPSPAAAAESDPHFELDIVFPRNETYFPADDFPIAIAIQNHTALRTLGDDYRIFWSIFAYTHGTSARGPYDRGDLLPLADIIPPGEHVVEEDGNHIFVGYTNASDWIQEKRPGDLYALHYYVDWDGYQERCGNGEDSGVTGHLMFSVEAQWETLDREWWLLEESDPEVRKPLVVDAPECPEFGSVVEITADPGNSSCPRVVSEDTGREPDPCAVVVDYYSAWNIDFWARVSARMDADLAAETAEPEETEEVEDEEDAAGGVALPRGVIATACALGWLAIAW